MLDLLIRSGLIIDGTGNPGRYGAVGVEASMPAFCAAILPAWTLPA